MRVEEIDALLGGEAQRLADQYRTVPLDFMDGYGWAVTQICRMFPDETPVIRCKDCKHFCNEEENYISEEGFAESECMYMPMARENDYCSRAERKEE